MLTVSVILSILALLLTCAAATGHCPLWAAVILLSILELLHVLPR